MRHWTTKYQMRFFIAVLQLSIILCYDTLKILKSGLDRGPIIIYDVLAGDYWEKYDDDELNSFTFYPLGNSWPEVEFDDNKIFMLLENNNIFYPFLRDILYDPKIDEVDYKQFSNCEDEESGDLGSLITNIKIFKDYSTFTAANLILGYVIKSAIIIKKLRAQLLSERQEVSAEVISARMTSLMLESGILKYTLAWGADSPLTEFIKKEDN